MTSVMSLRFVETASSPFKDEVRRVMLPLLGKKQRKMRRNNCNSNMHMNYFLPSSVEEFFYQKVKIQ